MPWRVLWTECSSAHSLTRSLDSMQKHSFLGACFELNAAALILRRVFWLNAAALMLRRVFWLNAAALMLRRVL